MPSKCVPGLEAALEAAGLEHLVTAAAAWCETMGARDMGEIAEEDIFEDFSSTLNLKKLEERRLRKLLTGGKATTPAPGPGPPSRPWEGSTVLVKNTFLDLDEPNEHALRRLQTEPVRQVDAELEELLASPDEADETPEVVPTNEQDMDADAGATEAEAPAGTPELRPTCSLYKTVTLDGYESMNEWGWADGEQPHHSVYGMGGHPLHGQRQGLVTCPEEGDPAMGLEVGSEEPSSSQGAAGGVPMHALPQMVGMVMVPAEALHPGFVVSQMPGAMSFPGCVAVPMDRFGRWPADMAQAWAQQGVEPSAGSGAPAGPYGGPAAEAAMAAAAAEAEMAPRRPQVLQSAFSVASHIYRVRWTVDARKLVSTDREHVSPPFELSFAGPVKFKMVMRPKVMSDEKGGQSFKKARGRGKILLRCVEDLDSTAAKPVVTFRIAVGNPHKQAVPRGPVRHDFSEKPICGLPEEIQQWDFTKAVDKSTATFVVCLEVLSSPQ